MDKENIVCVYVYLSLYTYMYVYIHIYIIKYYPDLEGNSTTVTTDETRGHLLFSCSVMSDSLQPHDCSTPGFPVPHCPLEFTQIHVH